LIRNLSETRKYLDCLGLRFKQVYWSRFTTRLPHGSIFVPLFRPRWSICMFLLWLVSPRCYIGTPAVDTHIVPVLSSRK